MPPPVINAPRWSKIFGRPACWAVVVLCGSVAFTWPFLVSPPWPAPWVYFFLFGAWGVLIFLIALIGTSLPDMNGRQPPDEA